MAVLIHNCQFVHIALHSIVREKKSKLADTNAGSHFSMFLLKANTQEWETTQSFNGGTTIYQTRKLEKPSKTAFPKLF